jgi:hypothetical protein
MPQLSTVKNYASDFIANTGVSALTASLLGCPAGLLGGAIVAVSNQTTDLAMNAVEKRFPSSSRSFDTSSSSSINARVAKLVIKIFVAFQLSAKLLSWQKLPALSLYSWMTLNVASCALFFSITLVASFLARREQRT